MFGVQASTQFFYSFTAFTLANFTSAFNINTTNVNFTNVVPAGVHARATEHLLGVINIQQLYINYP